MAVPGHSGLTGAVLAEPQTPAGRAGLAAILAQPRAALIAFDYDGTLSPIVDDPAAAVPEPTVVDGLAALSQLVGSVAVVTGRPAEVAVALGGFAEVPGLADLTVIGHYGLERWTLRSGEVEGAGPPPGVAVARRRIDGVLAGVGIEGLRVEDKGLSLAVHARGAADPAGALASLRGPLEALAAEAGLQVEPGRMVIELRPPDLDKGVAVRRLVRDLGARAVAFVGDDLGDLAAFAEVRRLREQDVPGVLVCSGSDEVAELAAQADLVVDGPVGVAAWVRALVAALRSAGD